MRKIMKLRYSSTTTNFKKKHNFDIDWQIDCLLYNVGLRYTETNLRLTLDVGEIRKEDLAHIM